jgi:hypothetical protein
MSATQAAAVAGTGVYEFLFSGTRLEVTNAAGAPVTPMAIK